MHLPLKHLFIVLLNAIVIVGCLSLVYMRFFDGTVVRVPITFNSDELDIPLDKTEYHPGETVKGYFDFCKHREILAEVQWELIDSYLIFFPHKDAATTKGCHQVWAEIAVIPKNIPPDPHVHFEGIIHYRVNMIHDVQIPLKTKTISVVK